MRAPTFFCQLQLAPTPYGIDHRHRGHVSSNHSGSVLTVLDEHGVAVVARRAGDALRQLLRSGVAVAKLGLARRDATLGREDGLRR